MEAADPHVEAAVLWLAQTILEVLFAGKMEAWIRQVGLAGETESLKFEIETVEAVVTAVKGRAAGNRPLARSLGRLKELLYDADDMVDELDYYRLQHQVEGGTIAWDNKPQGTDVNGEAQLVDGSRDNSGIPNRKKRSKAWKEFSIIEEDADGKPTKAECIYCRTVVRCETTKGTSVLHNHLKSENCKRKRAAMEQTPTPSSADDGAQNGATVSTHDSDRRKRIRSDEVLAHSTVANTDMWDKAEICNRIQQMTHQLQKAISEVQKLYGSVSVASSNLYQNTAADPCRRTSSLIQHKMYGRVTEKNSILQLITEGTSDGLLILPIVGIGGIGKTAIAQVVYNDPSVKSQFDYRIWIWVSSNFDEVKLTAEMLDFVSQEKCVGITNLARLQEILVTHVTSNRTLVVLDDIWDDINDCQWNKLLAPLRSDNAKGNVIIMTSRKLSIAKMICTVEPVKLGHLQNVDFWLLFKTCAFGDENYKEHPSLTIIGQQIANNLQGNPLAAQTAGMLLREHLTTDHWNNILKNEKWKSLQLNGGIMHALKLSYDELPFYLQQCFLYCSIFPNDHQFLSSELIYIWIAQGFVKCSPSTEKLEEMGQRYLTDLLNFGFFEQVETKDPNLGDKILYVMPALMHDFARLVSGSECAAIDDLTCRAILPTVRHLSILTYSAYQEDNSGTILRNEKFEGKLQRVVNSTRKLRTLVLIGKYDSYFLRSLQGIFQKAQKLRALKISEAYADFGYSACNVVNSTHVRYLNLMTKEDNEALPEALSKFYHLQVLDIGLDRYSTVPNGMNNLISLRHLVASKAVHSSISSIGKMTSLQELHDFKVDNCTSFEIAQLQSMSELAQLGVCHLEKVITREGAYGANLQEKSHLEKLHLSWEYQDNNMSSEPSYEVVEMGTSKVVLEGLEPHHGLKHLQISGYHSDTSPDWLVSNVSFTCLQILHLEDCRGLQVLPSLERLPLLTILKLRNMWKVRQVIVPSLEELVLIKMPKLERCSCNSVRDLNSSLRVLMVKECRVLKVFPLFESCAKLGIEQKSWLFGMSELTIHDCPCFIVSHSLPPSSSVCRLSISGVSTLPLIEGSTNTELKISLWRNRWNFFSNYPDEPMKLDDKILAFHNLRILTSLKLKNLDISAISLEKFRQLISLKSLEIYSCEDLFSSDVLRDHAHEDMANINFNAFPSLKRLRIENCGITGKWLSVMLRHAPALEELYLYRCDQISGLLIEGTESSSSNHTSAPRAPSAGNPDDALTCSTPDGLLRIPSNSVSSLKKMSIEWCKELTFQGNNEGFSGFTSLEELTICQCPKLISSLVQKYGNNDQRDGRWLLPYSLGKLEIDGSPETLQPFFLEDRNCLKKIKISGSPSLRLLQLHSCTALEELMVHDCASLAALDGNFTCLKELVLRSNPRLESLLLGSCTALEKLTITSCQSLAAPKFCEDLFSSDVMPQQVREDMADANFNALPSLKHLMIESCGITGKWLSVILRHAPILEEFHLNNCNHISGLMIEGRKSSSSNDTSTPQASSAGNPDGTLTSPTREELLPQSPPLSNLIPSLKKMTILRSGELTFQGGKKGFSGFTSLEELIILECPKLIPTLVHTDENNDQRNGRWLLPYSLVKLEIDGSPEVLQPCFLEGHSCLKKLKISYSPSLRLLQLGSCTALEELMVDNCASVVALEGNLTCLQKLRLTRNPGLERLLLRFCSALERLTVENCGSLIALDGNFTCLKELVLCRNGRLESLLLRSCTALVELTIENCMSLTVLQGDFTCLEELVLRGNSRLESVQLCSCTALERLTITSCQSLATLESFQSLRCLRYLHVLSCPGLLPSYLERLSSQGYELCAGLERLHTDDCSFLTTSFCKSLTSLQRLELRQRLWEVTRLTDEQGRAFQHLTSLQELRFEHIYNFADLPVGLHNLPSLKRLEIIDCSISRLPEEGLPPSLEELEISYSCSKELTDECRMLATRRSKPRVKIGEKYVN